MQNKTNATKIVKMMGILSFLYQLLNDPSFKIVFQYIIIDQNINIQTKLIVHISSLSDTLITCASIFNQFIFTR